MRSVLLKQRAAILLSHPYLSRYVKLHMRFESRIYHNATILNPFPKYIGMLHRSLMQVLVSRNKAAGSDNQYSGPDQHDKSQMS